MTARRTPAPALLVAIARSCFTDSEDLDTLNRHVAHAHAVAVRLTASPLRTHDDDALPDLAGAELWKLEPGYLAGVRGVGEAVSTSTMSRTSDDDAVSDIVTQITQPAEHGAFLFGLAVAFHMLSGKDGAR